MRAFGYRLLQGRLQLLQGLFELHREQDGGERHRQHVSHGLRKIDGCCGVRQEAGQDVDQGDQQHELPQHRYNDGADSVSGGDQSHLAGDLDAEQAQPTAVDAQRPGGEGQQGRVGGEQTGEHPGAQHHEGPQRHGVDEAGAQQQTEALPDAVCVPGAVVVAGNGLSALRQTSQGQQGELHDAGEDGHGAHGQIPAVFQQGGVEAHEDDALTGLHDKRGRSQRDAGRHQPQTGQQVLPPQAQQRLFAAEERCDPDAGQGLRQHGGQRRAPHAHVQSEDEQRVQRDIGQRADEHRQHAGPGEALGRHEGVEAQRQLDEHGADGIDTHVVGGVGDGVLAGAEQQQEVAAPQKQHGGEGQGQQEQQGSAAAQQPLRAGVVAAAHGNGGTGRTAGGHQCRKGGDDHDEGHAHAHAGEGQASVAGHVTNVDAVHDVVEHIYQLGRHRGDRQLEQEPPYRLRTEKCLVLLHKSPSAATPWRGSGRRSGPPPRPAYRWMCRCTGRSWCCRPRHGGCRSRSISGAVCPFSAAAAPPEAGSDAPAPSYGQCAVPPARRQIPAVGGHPHPAGHSRRSGPQTRTPPCGRCGGSRGFAGRTAPRTWACPARHGSCPRGRCGTGRGWWPFHRNRS